MPCAVDEGFALPSLQRKPSEHGDHEEAEFPPGKRVVGRARVDDSCSEHRVVQQFMAFREVSLRPLPDLADPTSLLGGSHGLRGLNQAVHPCHFGPKALRVRGGELELAFKLHHERIRRQIVQLIDVHCLQFPEVRASPQGPVGEQGPLTEEASLFPVFGGG